MPSTIVIDEPELGLHPYAILVAGRDASQHLQPNPGHRLTQSVHDTTVNESQRSQVEREMLRCVTSNVLFGFLFF